MTTSDNIVGLNVAASWISEWAYAAGIFAVAVRFQNQDKFWISHIKLHGAWVFDFFEKSKN